MNHKLFKIAFIISFISGTSGCNSCKHEPPIVTTTSVSAITTTTAVSGGNVTDNGGDEVTARGVCWSTTNNPIYGSNSTSDGTGNGIFTSNITGLTPNTKYYVRAYATNSEGIGYGSLIEFSTPPISTPTVTTAPVSSITESSAVSGGTVTDDGGSPVTSRGVCWSTTMGPVATGSHTIDGTGMGSFTSSITGLAPNTTYYIRAYATNNVGTAYGNEITFTTSATIPTITTTAASAITQTTATSGGNVTATGGSALTARGVCWSTSPNPTISDSRTTDGSGTGTFNSSITGLTPGIQYYLRAYATNSIGTAYGNEITFTANAILLATLSTSPITSITSTTAVSGGNITSAGGGTITDRGICWSTSVNPTVANFHTSVGTGTGVFTASITGLTGNTIYYVRAYATNSAGTGYGNQLSFESGHIPPTVNTTAVSNITSTSATSGGVVLLQGGENVTVKGVCWNTTGNPTIADSHTSDGAGLGGFTSRMNCLSHGTTYYVRAYATNSEGTGYGNQESFTTILIENPIVFNPNIVYGTVADIDGNCYKTVQIGAQTWIAENLKTTKYNDGTDIPLVTDNTEWNSLTTPGYCWYNNDILNKDIYGALYNYYTVYTEKLCPVGWHVSFHPSVSTDDGTTSACKIKENGTSHWIDPNYCSTNESGFTALPGGNREPDGTFRNLGQYGYWWVDMAAWWTQSAAYAAFLFVNRVDSDTYPFSMKSGFSVRCIKD